MEKLTIKPTTPDGDTPRTDAIAAKLVVEMQTHQRPLYLCIETLTEFACTLELELHQLEQEKRELEKRPVPIAVLNQICDMNEKIDALLAAGKPTK